MLKPVHTPIDSGDRITDVAAAFAATFAPSLALTTLAVRRFGSVEALVIVHLGDGGRETLSAGQARDLAKAFRGEGGSSFDPNGAMAESLENAAEAAERQASAILLGQGSDAGVRQARAFGGR